MTKKCNYCDGTGYAFGKIPCVCKDNEDRVQQFLDEKFEDLMQGSRAQQQDSLKTEEQIHVSDPTFDAAFPGLFAPGIVGEVCTRCGKPIDPESSTTFRGTVRSGKVVLCSMECIFWYNGYST